MATPIPALVETSDPPLSTDSDAQFDAKAFPWAASLDPFGQSVSAIAVAARDNAEDALAAALGGDLPPLTGKAGEFLRVKADESGAEFAEVPEPVTQSTADWEAGTSTTEGIVSPAKVKAAIEANAVGVDYQQFDVSGTWTRPQGFSDDAFILVEMWGAGGGNDGGGGAFSVWRGRLSDIGASETVTVGAGGSSSGWDGGSTSVSGVPIPGPTGGGGLGNDGGGAGGDGMQPGGDASGNPPLGDAAAGAGDNGLTGPTFGRGGNGGAAYTDGEAPGGGGGGEYNDVPGDGADGRVIIWVWG